jgi:hypothetical protein
MEITGVTGTITAGTITGGGGYPGSSADMSLYRQSVDRMLAAGTAASEAFSNLSSRANADDNAHVIQARRGSGYISELISYAGAQAMLGSAGIESQQILAQRAVQAQPQTTGQLVSAPPYQVTNAPPAVYSVNPTTGAITKA